MEPGIKTVLENTADCVRDLIGRHGGQSLQGAQVVRQGRPVDLLVYKFGARGADFQLNVSEPLRPDRPGVAGQVPVNLRQRFPVPAHFVQSQGLVVLGLAGGLIDLENGVKVGQGTLQTGLSFYGVPGCQTFLA